MRFSTRIASTLLVTSLLYGTAKADQISQTIGFPIVKTSYNTTLVFNEFDPSLGTLTAIQIQLDGSVRGTVSAENLGAVPATITTDLSSVLTLARPDHSVLIAATPIAQNSFQLSTYDNKLDYSGNSGVSVQNVTASQSESTTLTNPADLALFSGAGTITLGLSAIGNSTAWGSNNLATSFSTFAGASATITYIFSNLTPVPEPTSLALFGCGAAIFLSLLFRRGQDQRRMD